MKKYFIAAADFSGSPIHYHLCTSRFGETTHYGIQASWRGEEVCISDITTRKEAAMGLLARLRRGAVPPLALRDVVEDWLER
ncbi:MAG: hypothetical protein IJZ66_03260 [Oscillibacter sp.]|nr:hypothetical protein [Oscillibacter sp.]